MRPHGLARDEAMSDPRPLLSVSEASAFLVMEADARSAANAVLGWADAGLTVRTVRGRKMRTVERLFDEMAAAMLSDAVDVELSVLARLIESARREYSAPIELGEWWDRPAVPVTRRSSSRSSTREAGANLSRCFGSAVRIRSWLTKAARALWAWRASSPIMMLRNSLRISDRSCCRAFRTHAEEAQRNRRHAEPVHSPATGPAETGRAS
jgi:hypothetical protein